MFRTGWRVSGVNLTRARLQTLFWLTLYPNHEQPSPNSSPRLPSHMASITAEWGSERKRNLQHGKETWAGPMSTLQGEISNRWTHEEKKETLKRGKPESKWMLDKGMHASVSSSKLEVESCRSTTAERNGYGSSPSVYTWTTGHGENTAVVEWAVPMATSWPHHNTHT